jgi:hypothetical protein
MLDVDPLGIKQISQGDEGTSGRGNGCLRYCLSADMFQDQVEPSNSLHEYHSCSSYCVFQTLAEEFIF